MGKNLVPWKERVSYGLSDTASNLVFQMIQVYMMFFYTDVFQLPAAAVATLLLSARVLDGFIDPFVGIMIDKTSTKWGKCRPYFLWFAIPYGLIAMATFYTPALSVSGKLVYAYVTYIAINIVYSIINLPVTAILPSLTDDYNERTSVSAVRMLLAMVGGIVVSTCTMPLVKALGNGNDKNGFFFTMIIFGTVAMILFINAFVNVKERVVANEGKPVPVKEGVKALKNLPWFISLMAGTLMFVAMTMKQSTTVYYMQYNLGRLDLVPMFMLLGSVGLLPTLAISPMIATKIGKRNTIIFGNVIALLGLLIMAIWSENITLLLVGSLTNALGMGFGVAVTFAMIADIVDYGEWKRGVRAQGLLSAAGSFGSKCGMGIGAGLAAATLAIGNYVPNATQTPEALMWIKFNFIWAPIVSTILIIVLYLFYKVDKLYPQIKADLDAKRNAANAVINA